MNYKCCVCDNSFEVKCIGKIFSLTDSYYKNIESSTIHCPDCGSQDVELISSQSE